jgi:hypothetical protein
VGVVFLLLFWVFRVVVAVGVLAGGFCGQWLAMWHLVEQG